MHNVFRQVMRKGPKLEESIAVCSTEIKAERKSVANRRKLHVCLYSAWTAI